MPKVLYFSGARKITNVDVEVYDSVSDFASLRKEIIIKHPDLQNIEPHLFYALNCCYIDIASLESKMLEEGDEIALIPPVSGG